MKIFHIDVSPSRVKMDHASLERMVLEIRQHLPRMLREHPDRDEFWSWFRGEAESLFRHVRHDEDRLYFQDFINKTLEDAGLEERFELTRRQSDRERVEWPASDARHRTPRATNPSLSK